MLESCVIQELCRNGNPRGENQKESPNSNKSLSSKSNLKTRFQALARQNEGILMEHLAAQPPTQESFRSFDILASVDLCRFDLENFGYIHEATKQRVEDEELSYIAEGINRPLYTEFVLQQWGGELVYFNEGQWQPYISTLKRGKKVAEREAELDERKMFTAQRAERDLYIGQQLEQLEPGQTLRWYSTFPGQEAAIYGEKFIGSLGYQPARRMGFLYRAERNFDGSVSLQSQSVDSSDEEAFEIAMTAEDDDIQSMRSVYDSVLAQKYGEPFYAGRPQFTRLPEENAWTVVGQHQDLVKHYLAEIQVLASETGGSRSEQERAKKRLTYGVWAALKNRLDQSTALGQVQTKGAVYNLQTQEAFIRDEIESAYQEASAKGEVLFGCGGAVSGEDAILNASSESVFESIFGEKSSVMKCVKCPFCSKTVDAIKTKTHISCPKCKAQAKL